MQELGNIQRALNPWAVFNPWDSQEETKASLEGSSESSRFHIYDDAAAANINPWAVFNPWDTQGTQSTSESSGEGSRFHVDDTGTSAAANPWAVFNPWDTRESEQNMGINSIIRNQIKAEAKKAMQCQANLGPQRVLHLL